MENDSGIKKFASGQFAYLQTCTHARLHSEGIMAEEKLVMEITEKERRQMNNKIIQLWRFIVLNLKILKAVDHSKRS